MTCGMGKSDSIVHEETPDDEDDGILSPTESSMSDIVNSTCF